MGVRVLGFVVEDLRPVGKEIKEEFERVDGRVAVVDVVEDLRQVWVLNGLGFEVLGFMFGAWGFGLTF